MSSNDNQLTFLTRLYMGRLKSMVGGCKFTFSYIVGKLKPDTIKYCWVNTSTQLFDNFSDGRLKRQKLCDTYKHF